MSRFGPARFLDQPIQEPPAGGSRFGPARVFSPPPAEPQTPTNFTMPTQGDVDPRMLELARSMPGTQFDFSDYNQTDATGGRQQLPALTPQQDFAARQSVSLSPGANQLIEQAGRFNLEESLRAMGGQQVRSSQDIIQENMQSVPRPLRPVISGAYSSLGSTVALGGQVTDAVGLTDNFADYVLEESGNMDAARTNLGTSMVEDALQGAVQSISDLIFLAPTGGAGVVGGFVSKAVQDAEVTGREAGLEGSELGKYMMTQGAIEGAVTITAQRLGLGGLERTPTGEAIKGGLRKALRQVGIQTLSELGEENLIAVGNAVADVAFGVDAQALSPENLGETIAKTTLTTLMTMGLAEGGRAVADKLTGQAQKQRAIRNDTSEQAVEAAAGESVGSAPAQPPIIEAAERAGLNPWTTATESAPRVPDDPTAVTVSATKEPTPEPTLFDAFKQADVEQAVGPDQPSPQADEAVRRDQAVTDAVTEEADALIADMRTRGDVSEADEARIRQLVNEARRNPLTGGMNRNAFSKVFDAVRTRARKTNKPVSIIAIDAKNLKIYNDNISESAGDAYLRRAQGVLENALRGSDQGRDRIGDAFHYGGDEWAIILPDTDAKGAAIVRDRIEQAFGSKEIVPGVSDGLVGGVVQIDPDSNVEMREALDVAVKEMKTRKTEQKRSAGEATTREEAEARATEAARQSEPISRATAMVRVAQEAASQPDENTGLVTPAEMDTPTLRERLASGEGMAGRQEDTRAMRRELNLRELEQNDAQSFEGWRQEAIDQAIPDRAVAMARGLLDNPRVITPVENAGMVLKLRSLYDQHTTLTSLLEKAESDADIKSLAATRNEIEQDIDVITDALDRAAGTEAGRALVARKLAVQKDWSLASLLMEGKARKGAPLTPEERTKIEDLERQHRKAQKKVDDHEKSVERARAKDSVDRERHRSKRKKPVTPEDLDAALAEMDPADPDYLAKVALNRAAHPAHNKTYQSVLDATRAAVPVAPGTDIATQDVVIEDAVYRYLTSRRAQTKKKVESLFNKFKKDLMLSSKLRNEIGRIQDELETGWWREKRPNGKSTKSALLEVLEAKRKTLAEERSLQKEIDDIETRLRAGDYSEQARAEREDDGLDYLRKRLRERRAELALLRDITNLERQLQTGEFDPPHRSERQASNRLMELEAKRNILRAQVAEWRDALTPRTPWQRTADVLGVPRSLMAMADVSMVGIQGAWMIYTHPIQTIRALPNMLKAFTSEKTAQQALDEILNGRHYAQFVRAGGEITSFRGNLNDREEQFRSEIAERIPGAGQVLKSSTRAYTTYLNALRYYGFAALVEADGGLITDERAALYAGYINSATGRGSLGPKDSRLHKAAGLASVLFFSPRNWASRIQMVSGYPLIKAAQAGDKRATYVLAKEYMKFTVGLGVLMGLWELWGGEVEFDHLNPGLFRLSWTDENGKGYNFDPSGQLGGELAFWTRLFTGTKRNRAGDTVDIRYADWGQGDAFSLVTRKMRGKLSPVASWTIDAATGSDYLGKPFEPVGATISRLYPLAANDIASAAKASTPEGKAALTLLSLLGGRPWRLDEEEANETWEAWAREKDRRRKVREAGGNILEEWYGESK